MPLMQSLLLAVRKNTHINIIKIAINKAGSEALLASQIGVTAETVKRWKSGKSIINKLNYGKVIQWLSQKKTR